MAFDVLEALKKNEVKVEDIIGVTGDKASRLCVVSGRRLVQPWVTYHLDNGRYVRVLARFQNRLGEELLKKLHTMSDSGARSVKTAKSDNEVKS